MTKFESNNLDLIDASYASRGFALTFALVAYLMGAGALFWLILAVGGLLPYGFSDIAGESVVAAIVTNFILVCIFGVQHSVMARKRFKIWITRYIPEHLERAMSILVSGIVTATLVWNWQTLPGIVWLNNNEIVGLILHGVYGLGIIYLLGSSFITNHFELFGLRQAWLYTCKKEYTPLNFKRHFVYRYSRHLMMLGLLLIFWSTPEMTVTRFCLAVLLSIYIFIGVAFEEKSLVEEFGSVYKKYKKEVGMLFTVN